MEIKALRYFLAVAREENMTRASETLHVSQPTLSKTIKALEAELGARLFERHAFSLRLTDAGMLLRKRADDLVTMADKISAEFEGMNLITGGDVYFGLAESWQIRHLARVIRKFGEKFPDFRYHITSGDTEQVTEKLDRGLLDFAVLVEPPDPSRYESLLMPEKDVWGLIFPSTDPLAEKERIEAEDLIGLPLYCSEQSIRADLPRWCGGEVERLTFRGTFRLAYNASVFAREGLGYLLTFDHLIDTGPGSGLVFRPLFPALESPLYLIWRRDQVFTPIAQYFLDEMREYCEKYRENHA